MVPLSLIHICLERGQVEHGIPEGVGAGGGQRDLAGHKSFAAALGFMVEQNAGAAEHVIDVYKRQDLERVTDTLISLGMSPNVGAILIVSLGCEGTDHERMYKELSLSLIHIFLCVSQKFFLQFV